MFRIKELLKEKGYTATSLSNELGVSNNTVTRIANNVSSPSLKILLDISKVLNVDIRELFKPNKGDVLLNGFIEYKDNIYKIYSENDLKKLMDEINEDG